MFWVFGIFFFDFFYTYSYATERIFLFFYHFVVLETGNLFGLEAEGIDSMFSIYHHNRFTFLILTFEPRKPFDYEEFIVRSVNNCPRRACFRGQGCLSLGSIETQHGVYCGERKRRVYCRAIYIAKKKRLKKEKRKRYNGYNNVP